MYIGYGTIPSHFFIRDLGTADLSILGGPGANSPMILRENCFSFYKHQNTI
jgi:hypothetical protein